MLQNGKEKSHDFADVIQTAMTHLIYWRDNSHDALLFSADLSEAGDSLMALNVNVMRLLSFVVPAGAGYLNGVHWDFILCSLASWIQVGCKRFIFLQSLFSKAIPVRLEYVVVFMF